MRRVILVKNDTSLNRNLPRGERTVGGRPRPEQPLAPSQPAVSKARRRPSCNICSTSDAGSGLLNR